MKKLQSYIHDYLKARGWLSMSPADLAKSISIEAAELLEIFQWSNRSTAETVKDSDQMDKIKKELSDVMIYCFDMAILLGIDLEEAIYTKMAHNEKKYPAELMNVGKEASNKAYFKRKQEYRKKGIN